jgi:hypothetical protein
VLEKRQNQNEKSMKKVKRDTEPEMKASYKRSDFGVMVRGKYADRIKEGTNVVLLDPDVAKAFPNDKAVNDALRKVMAEGEKKSIGESSPASAKRRRAS